MSRPADHRPAATAPSTAGHPGTARTLAGLLLDGALLLGSLSMAGGAAAQAAQPPAEPAQDPASTRFEPLLPAVPALPALTTAPVLDGAYAANARVGRLRLSVAGAGAPADGVSPVVVTIEVFDRDGQPLRDEVLVTLEHSGSARLQLAGAATDEFGPAHKDEDRRVPGTQLKVKDGVARFSLIAPAVPEDVWLRASAGAAEVSGVVPFTPDLREMVATGLVEGVLALSRGSAPTTVVPAGLDDGFETALSHFARDFDGGRGRAAARAALFMKGDIGPLLEERLADSPTLLGKIQGATLLTLAYDSDKDQRAHLLRDIKPEEYYPVYGDASLRTNEARSASHLYVRVDRGRSFALWGDFNTAEGFANSANGSLVRGTRLRQLGAYNRNATGALLHDESRQHVLNVYASRDSLRQVTDELRGNGSSGPFALSQASAVEYSERVELLVRDRNDLTRVLSSTPLVRLNDYAFEPFSGRLLLTRPVPSVDADGNPISLRISYEVDQGGEAYWLLGADGQLNLGERLSVGGSVVDDQNPLSPYRLASANLGWKWSDSTAVVAELAHTEAVTGATAATPAAPVTGQAGRLLVEHHADGRDLRVWLQRAGSGFVNGASGAIAGSVQAGVDGALRLDEPWTLRANLQETQDLGNDARRRGATLGADYRLGPALTLSGGLRQVHEEGRIANATSTVGDNPSAGSSFGGASGGGFSGAGSSTLLNANGLGSSSIGNSGSAAGTVPDLDTTTAFVGARLKLGERWGVEGELEQSVQGGNAHREMLGTTWQLAERTRLYARGETQTGLASRYGVDGAGRSNVFALGVDSSYAPGASAFGEFRLRDTADARATQMATGLRNAWALREGLVLSTGAERVQVLGNQPQSASALSVGADYTASEQWKASGRLEWRRLDQAAIPVAGSGSTSTVLGEQDSWLSTLTVARRLDRDWTLLARNYALVTDNHGVQRNGWQDRFQVGAAYRPVDDNRLDVLTKAEHKVESNINGGDEWRRAEVAALQLNAHPVRSWWWSGRLAGKTVREQFPRNEGGGQDRYRAGLVGARVIHDVSERFDLGLMAQLMKGRGDAPGTSATSKALGLEGGWLMQANLWLSAGFNWHGFSDRDLTNDHTRRGAFIRLRWKFDADLFAGDDPRVNRSLPR